MNALELADAIQYCGDGGYNLDAANMLRQQQAEIEKLGSELDRIVELYTDKAIENEALKDKLETAKKFAFNMNIRAVKAEKRELTDEEIEEVAKPYCDLQNWVVDKHEFARAILKKASENV